MDSKSFLHDFPREMMSVLSNLEIQAGQNEGQRVSPASPPPCRGTKSPAPGELFHGPGSDDYATPPIPLAYYLCLPSAALAASILTSAACLCSADTS